MTKRTTRDFDADFEAAMVDEYEGYMRAGRTEDAAAVAKVLKEQYDHDVKAKAKSKDEPNAEPKAERADVKAPEKAVPDKPEPPVEDVKRGPGRPPKA